MDNLNPRPGLFRRILTSRLLRYPLYLFLLLTLIGIFLPEDTSLETAQYLHANTNPWRDLPADQQTALKEVLFIAETLRDVLLPTSLPDDDYEFLSKLLRSLETRVDISWTTLYETGVDRTVSAIANRPRGEYFAPEPFGLVERFERLHAHWSRLDREEGKPERWKVEHDTVFLPPLIKARGLDGGAAEESGGLEASLSNEQRGEMEERYAEWKKDRDRKVSYLKDHPPTPMAWFPVSRQEGGIRAAWDEVMDGGVVEAGKRVAERLLVASPRWKPMYRSLMTERVPIGWRTPGEEEMTREELDRWMERLDRKRKQRAERTRKQDDMQEKLKVRRDMAQGAKDEL